MDIPKKRDKTSSQHSFSGQRYTKLFQHSKIVVYAKESYKSHKINIFLSTFLINLFSKNIFILLMFVEPSFSTNFKFNVHKQLTQKILLSHNCLKNLPYWVIIKIFMFLINYQNTYDLLDIG